MGLHWKNPSNLLKIWEGGRLGGEVFGWILGGLGGSWDILGGLWVSLGRFWAGRERILEGLGGVLEDFGRFVSGSSLDFLLATAAKSVLEPFGVPSWKEKKCQKR